MARATNCGYHLVGAVLLLLAASSLLVLADASNHSEASLLARLGISKLPEIFSFDKFRQVYNKHYGSPVEESHRNKLFLPRAFQAFVTFSKYLAGFVPKYTAINHMSDLTPEEREQLYEPADPMEELAADRSSSAAAAAAAEIPAANLEDIEREFVEIEQHKDESPEYAQIVAQLKLASNEADRSRRKRNADAKPAPALTVDQLLRDPSRIQEPRSPKFSESIPSNNPDYVEPQFLDKSKSDTVEDSPRPLGEAEASKIDHASPSSLLSSLVGFVRKPFSGSRRLHGHDEMQLDYRQSGCIGEIHRQGRCNTCYIFSIMALFEYHHCKQTEKLVPFSVQYVLDCGKLADIGLNGCSPSPPEATWLFVQKFGLQLAANYPYRGQVRTCPYKKTDKSVSHMGHTRVREVNHVDLAKHNQKKEIIDEFLRTKGPLVIGMKVDRHFNDYGGGVDSPKHSFMSPRHAMAIVGMGIEAGQQYWLIKNSQGKDWGLAGYYKLSKDVDPRVIVKISYMQAKFDKNIEHDEAKLREALGGGARSSDQ